jgi:hypothetical protein
LASNDALAYITLPYGPHCYWPARTLISELIEDLKSYDGIERLNIRRFDLPHTFKTPPSGEEHYSRNTLNTLFSIIANLSRTTHIETYELQVIQANQVGSRLSFFCASRTSSPEPVLMFAWNDSCAGLIASEAKSISASLFTSMCQAVQMASDCALNMLQYLEPENIVVPYIICSGFSVQFGVVYLMQNSYPCAVTLSEELSLLNAIQVRVINQWIVALSKFCKKMMQQLVERGRSNAKMIPIDSIRVEINKDFLFKPIVVSDTKYATSKANYLMHIFYKLWNSNARQYVQFPVGTMGYPHRSPKFVNFLKNKFKLIAIMSKKDDDEYYCSVVDQPGHPIFVYENLLLNETDGWNESSILEGTQDTILKEKFVMVLEAALKEIEAAGVIHLDLRLPNIFYREIKPITSVLCNESSESLVEIRIIDWDDCLLIEDQVDRSLYYAMQNDHRYPHGEEFQRAIPQYHQFFLQKIKEMLSINKRVDLKRSLEPSGEECGHASKR